MTPWVLPFLVLGLVPGGLAMLSGAADGPADVAQETVHSPADLDPIVDDADDLGASDLGAGDNKLHANKDAPSDDAVAGKTLPEEPGADALGTAETVGRDVEAAVDAVTGEAPSSTLRRPAGTIGVEVNADAGVANAAEAEATAAGTDDRQPAGQGDSPRDTSADRPVDAHAAVAATVAVAAHAGAPWLAWWYTLAVRVPGLSAFADRALSTWEGGGRLVGRAVRQAWVLLALLLPTPVGAFFLRGQEIPDSPAREAILEHLRSHPGSSIRAVQRAQDVAWGTAVYHLNRLEKAGRVVSHRSGRAHRYWDSRCPEAAQRRRVIVLKSETPRRLAVAVQAEPGLAQKQLCQRLGMSPSVASKHLSRLAAAGLVEVQPRARARIYYPTPALEKAVHVMGGRPATGAGNGVPNPPPSSASARAGQNPVGHAGPGPFHVATTTQTP